jgi:Cdc6-like AAA superfamily ATPase
MIKSTQLIVDDLDALMNVLPREIQSVLEKEGRRESSSASAISTRTTAPASSAPCTASRPSATAAGGGGPDLPRGPGRLRHHRHHRGHRRSGKSILLLGRPGVGKTTMLREAARMLAETKRVVIVDTSNEIAGDGDIPHPAIGRARRMQVPCRRCSTR